MNGTDIIVIAVILLVLGGAVAYIIKQKRSGAKCIGCPHGKAATKGNNNSCGCSCNKD